MTAVETAPAPEAYEEILADYLQTHSEEALYRVSLLSQTFVESGMGPEDIIALHFEALESATASLSYREQARAIGDAHQFLLEVMIAYGVKYKEYLELKLRESMREAEAQAELGRQRAMDAERSGRQKSEILGVIAHELRTPITAALGNLDLAYRSLSRGQTERLPRLIATAREALDRLSRLSADLVEASLGEVPMLEHSSLELQRVVQQACTWAEAAALAQGVSLDLETSDVSVPISGNEDGLLSLFGNLLSNAIRYSPKGGRVIVRYGAADDVAWVEIKDSGIGMSPDVQARIFEKFYRAPQAREVEARGLGLGLALVQQILDGHRGRIEVKSADGAGSTFRVELPIMRPDGGEV